MLRRRRDAALLAPRGRYARQACADPPTLPATHPPSTPGSAPTSLALSAALSPLWPVAPSLPPRLRNPGPSSARLGSPPRPLAGHVGVGPFWGGGEGRGQGTGRTEGRTEQGRGTRGVRARGTERGWMGRGGGAGTGRRAWRERVVGSRGRVGADTTGRRGEALRSRAGRPSAASRE